jgi:hypothetical protein
LHRLLLHLLRQQLFLHLRLLLKLLLLLRLLQWVLRLSSPCRRREHR